MSSTYLVLKNNNEHNSSISVEASAHPIKEFGVSDFVYLTLIVLLMNLFFKGVSMVLNFLKQRWIWLYRRTWTPKTEILGHFGKGYF